RSTSELTFEFTSGGYGILRDTLIVETTDPANPVFTIPVEAYGKRPFQIVDNSDETNYHENGSWNYSVAHAYGTSSRWISISEANKEATATYQLTIPETSRYALSFIVPGATNSALRALYEVEINGNSVLSRVINQNVDRSAWKWLGSLDAYSGDNLEITVSMVDVDQPGRVLRADAVQIEELGANRKEKIVDLESDEYSESGTWHTSNSSAWGTFSRYTAANNASATYDLGHVEAGLAEVEILLPFTENAVENARYRAFRADKVLGESIIDQNIGSGSWAPVGVYPVDIAGEISVMVDYPETGAMNGVLRTGGIRLTYGGDSSSTSVHEEVDTPLQVKLHQNYPNPFNPTTNIRFEIAQSDRRTSLAVYDILGRRVASLVDGLLSAGSHTVPFDGSSLASGVYIYQLQHDGIVLQQKMMLIK
ncbi:MAG: T9SS type A sorting domain-containing protein, partial [Balneolales bacterium]|nr:T9SS type A sorting domain-containing protein [Balneolales bacterium]